MGELRGTEVFDGDIKIATIVREKNEFADCDYTTVLIPVANGDSGWKQYMGAEPDPKYYGELFACSICHGCAKANYLGTTGSRLAEKRICFTCDHWLQLIEKDAHEYRRRHVIVDGRHYVMGDNTTEPHRWSGFGGDTFVIEFFDGRKVVSNNLWHQGTIPERWREQLADNAKFVRPDRQALA